MSSTPIGTLADLRTWISRTLALVAVWSLVMAWLMAGPAIPHLRMGWQALFGGGITLLTLLLVISSWRRRGFGTFAIEYALVVLAGILTWPLAWTGPLPNPEMPWLWMCIGVSTVGFGVGTNYTWGVLYCPIPAVAFGWLRSTPSGGSLSLLNIAQDSLTLAVLPLVSLTVAHYFELSAAQLDDSLVVSRQEESEAAVEQALVDERRRLDAIVHDEVMTTLVAATKSAKPHEAHVTALAKRALASLAEAQSPSEAELPVTGRRVQWLIRDVVESVSGDAVFTSSIEDPTVSYPHPVVRALSQATREAVLNSLRHAGADTIAVDLRTLAQPLSLTLTIRDDGQGFDPDQIPDQRLGIRLSLVERLRHVGGQAQVESEVDRGTNVTLSWARPDDGPLPRRSRALGPSHPVISTLHTGQFVGLVWLVVVIQVILGLTALDQVTAVWPVLLAQGAAMLATALSLHASKQVELPVWSGLAVLLLLTVMTELVQGVLPSGVWPGYATWHASVVMVVLIVLLVRGRGWVAWLGCGLFTLQTLLWAGTHGMGYVAGLRILFGAVSWLVAAALIVRWLRLMDARLADSQQSSHQANQTMAASFAKLVSREVWLTRLSEQVGDLLRRLADPAEPITAAQREDCRIVEAGLRDEIRAGSLLSDGVVGAIAAARLRGVDVTLVDNRDADLPEPVRHATWAQLEEVLKASHDGRVVVRAAPVGYSDAVTIVHSSSDEGPTLITIDESGGATVSRT